MSISPKFGTCVIFNTDPWSVHSVRPISDSSAARRTIGLYYFTAEADDVITRERWPKWYEEGSLSATSPVDKARLAGTKTALGASRAFARLANKMDPRRPSR